MSDDKIAIAEIFHSIQGEGLYAGVPAIFVRLAGCNLTCPGWGTTGCDTTEVWRHTWKKLTPEETIVHIRSEWPNTEGWHLIITGGEPTLQWNLVSRLAYQANTYAGHYVVELETNGTIMPGSYPDHIALITCSPKLMSAGNPLKKAYVPEVLRYFAGLQHVDVVWKFVVQKEEDLEEVDLRYVRTFGLDKKEVYLMPEGATCEAIQEHSKQVVEWCKKYGYRYSPRLQLSIWDKATGV